MIDLREGYVYMITSPSGRIYIGSTDNVIVRWNYYKKLYCKSQRKLYNSLVKYGFENHIFEIVWKGNLLERLKYEYLIGTYYEVLNKGLNCCLPGYNDVPGKISNETRLKISKTLTGKKKSEEQLISFRKAMKNRMYTKEHIEKLRQFGLKRAEIIREYSSKKVIQITTGLEFRSIIETAKFFNFSTDYISSQLSGRRRNKLNLKFK